MATKTFFLNSDLALYGENEWNYVQKFLFESGVLKTRGTTWNDFVDLVVLQNGTPDMSVDISIGVAIVEITKSAQTFKVFAQNLATANVAVTSNATGYTRYDAVILRVSTTTEPNSLMNNIATLEVKVGNNSANLTDGQIQTIIGADGFIRLANIAVPNGASTITTGIISDTRIRAKNNDSVLQSPSAISFRALADDPTGADLVDGLTWYNTTNNQLRYYNGTITIPVVSAYSLDPSGGLEIVGGMLKIKPADEDLAIDAGGLSVVSGVAANKLVRLDGDAKIPAVDGSQLLNLQNAPIFRAVVSTTVVTDAGGVNHQSNSGTWTKKKEVLYNDVAGNITIMINGRQGTNTSSSTSARIYINGVARGTLRTLGWSDTGGVNWSEDFAVVTGDLIQIYLSDSQNRTAMLGAFRLEYAKTVITTENTVNL